MYINVVAELKFREFASLNLQLCMKVYIIALYIYKMYFPEYRHFQNS